MNSPTLKTPHCERCGQLLETRAEDLCRECFYAEEMLERSPERAPDAVHECDLCETMSSDQFFVMLPKPSSPDTLVCILAVCSYACAGVDGPMMNEKQAVGTAAWLGAQFDEEDNNDDYDDHGARPRRAHAFGYHFLML